jgi:stage II sporulation protein D
MIRRRAMVAITLFVVILASGGCRRGVGRRASISAVGASLQERATAALGEREGAVLVIDPRTGRLLAAVNPRLASEQAFPPGSTIKPFSALAALESGRIFPDWRHRCAGGIRDDSGNLLCSHPRIDAPMSLDEAIAWSCNDYFLALGERLGQSAFHKFLQSYGFGNPAEWASGRAGRLIDLSGDRAEADGRRLHAAIGEGADLLVTPLQLLRGYQGMVNGGLFCRPVTLASQEVDAGCRDQIRRSLPELHRRLIIAGMRGAVTFGTAAGAGLAGNDSYIFGKTGTSTASDGFRRHGWFVGFAAPGMATADSATIPAPGAVTTGVLVFLRRGTGAEAAAVAGRILAGATPRPASVKSTAVQMKTVSASVFRGRGPQLRGQQIRVLELGTGRVVGVSLEDYIAGVVAAEAGQEREREALRAQAVASRTFAVYNRGRHSADGYDFCSTTHCQRFGWSSIPNQSARQPSIGRNIAEAVASTTGVVILEPGGGVAEIFYHAACGGQTSEIADVWGVKSGSSYLRGRRGTSDPHCATRPERQWEDRLTIEELERALSAGEGTGALGRLRDLAVERRDRTGRVALIRLRGSRDLVLRGWDFRLIIARTLGWQILKSTRFELSRSGKTFRFRGRGFGHGLGLCQDGAHDLARQGLSYRRILAHYFPGTVIDRRTVHLDEDREPRMLPAAWGKNPDQQIVTNGNIEWFYHADGSSLGSGVMYSARRILEAARRDLEKRLGRSLSQRIEIHVHGTTAGFIAATGRSGWVAATTRSVRIDLQPPAILERRRILESTLRHEYVHAAIATLNREPIPRWLAEGLAIHFAGEGESFLRYLKGRPRLSRSELESRLAADNPSLQSRYLYAMAYLEVRQIISTRGEAAAWRLATESTTTASRDSILTPMAIAF